MLLTTVGMFFAASLGTLAGQSHPITVVLAGVLGLLYGITIVFSEDGSWIGLQCTIAFLVATAFPAHGWHALLRGGLVFRGRLDADPPAARSLARPLFLVPGRPASLQSSASRTDSLERSPARRCCSISPSTGPNFVMPHVLVSRSCSLSFISRSLHQINSYWLPMTALIVTKPDFYRTYTSSLGRVFGTFAGIGVASLLTHTLHPDNAVLVILVLAFAWATFAWQKVNYAVFSCALTAFIVFLVALAGLPETTVTANRLLTRRSARSSRSLRARSGRGGTALRSRQLRKISRYPPPRRRPIIPTEGRPAKRVRSAPVMVTAAADPDSNADGNDHRAGTGTVRAIRPGRGAVEAMKSITL